MFSSNTSQVSSSASNYVEDVFSTYLYTGNSTSGGSQTITNNIDLSTKGGLVWIKGRSAAAYNVLWDTARGAGTGSGSTVNKAISSNDTGPQGLSNTSDYLSAFSSSGFTVTQGGAVTAYRDTNYNAVTYASWTFRKQEKFFDVVTYTGNGANRTIAHNLGSVPGCIIVKRTDTTGNWQVYHRSLANTEYMVLNSTAAKATGTTRWNSTTPTSTVFSVGTDATVNANGGTYVAYIFSHDAGGFGLAGTDNVISCGSFTTDGSGNASVNLGYEPQWVLIKGVGIDSWRIGDVMRGFSFSNFASLSAESSGAETNWGANVCNPTSTGFYINGANAWTGASIDYIYIAIRRGPMKTPTSGTSVFSPLSFNSSSSAQTINPGITTDLCMLNFRNTTNGFEWFDRLRGITGTTGSGNPQITSASTAAEANSTDINGAGQTTLVAGGTLNGYTQIVECFSRAPGFMDVVCYTGTDNDIALTHNLGVAPEAIILKKRSGSGDWTYETNFTSTQHTYLTLNDTIAGSTANYSGGVNLAAQPTSTTVTVAGGSYSTSGSTYVMYLFATCAGVSKVGTYTGTGTTKQIDCGFTGGARFVMIKRTDSTGAWYVWDSARGIVSGNDPYLLLNSTAAEVTNTDYIDTYSAGFEISSTAPAAINANGGSFIFLAVA